MKTMIAKHMTATNSTKYYDILENLVEAYNESPHSSINDIPPTNAFTSDNYLLIKNINREKMLHNINVSKKLYKKIDIGDSVRVRKKKTVFDKGYEVTYSTKIYQVVEIKNNKATLDDNKDYKLTDLLVVDALSDTPTDNKERKQANQKATLKRRLNKEGLDYESEDDVDYFKEV
jgi:hypothetical protein